MRVAVNAAILDEWPGGLGVYTTSIIRGLAGLGAQLIVYTSAPAAVGGVPARRAPRAVRPSRGALGHLARICWSQAVFPLMAKREQASVAFAATPTEGATFPLIPQVVMVHDLLPLWFPDEFPRVGLYFRRILPGILKHSAAVLTPSASTRRECVESYALEPDRVFVVPEGCAAEYTPDGKATAIGRVGERWGVHDYLLYVGSDLPHKNLPGLLDSFAAAAPKIANPLVIVGRKDPRFHPDLEHQAAALGIKGRLRFLDAVPSAALPDLYRAATGFVFLSFSEGFGLPVLEAMASGVPVVCSNLSSIPEVAGDAACLVDPRDPRSCGEALVRLAADGQWRSELSARGLERARRFSWERAAGATLRILEDAARAGNP